MQSGMEVPFERKGGVYVLGLWVRQGSAAADAENQRHFDKVRAEAKKRAATDFSRR